MTREFKVGDLVTHRASGQPGVVVRVKRRLGTEAAMVGWQDGTERWVPLAILRHADE